MEGDGTCLCRNHSVCFRNEELQSSLPSACEGVVLAATGDDVGRSEISTRAAVSALLVLVTSGTWIEGVLGSPGRQPTGPLIEAVRRLCSCLLKKAPYLEAGAFYPSFIGGL